MRFIFTLAQHFALGLIFLLLLSGRTLADKSPNDGVLTTPGISANPQAAYGFLGNDFLGRALGLKEPSGLRLGGFLIPEFDWVASGTMANSAFGSVALGLHASVDMQKTLNIPGGTFGIEFLETAGGFNSHGSNNQAAGSVQMYTNMDGPQPRNRQEIMQLWWHQRLFDDRLIIHVGKLNGTGHFNTVLKPVILSEPHLQDSDISTLIFTPIGENPTLYGKLPAYYNTAYGAVVHFMPTKELSVSYGIFDGNQASGSVQTGLRMLPKINSYKFNIGEVGYSWRLGKIGMPGRIGVGGWWQTGKLNTPSFTTENGATGYYLFANQRLWYKEPSINNSGMIGYVQYGHTGSQSSQVNDYFGAGISGIGLVPKRPLDLISLGMARSDLNHTPGAGAYFWPNADSNSLNFSPSELMFQTDYQANFALGSPENYWTLSAIAAYTYIPTPGYRPDLPAANVLSLRLVALF